MIDAFELSYSTDSLLQFARDEKHRRDSLRKLLKAEGVTSLLTLEGHPYYDLYNIEDREDIRYIVLEGGRGGAKSSVIAEKLLRKASNINSRILCAREYQNSIADSVHRLLRDTIDRFGWTKLFKITKTSIKSTICDSEFLFKGLHDNVQEIKSTAGITDCWVEEAQTVTEYSWEVLDPTIREPNSKIYISFNAKEESDATYKRFILNPPEGTLHHHINYDQNPYFPNVLEKIRLHYLKMITDAQTPDERIQAQSDYDHVWLGLCKTINNEVIFAGKFVVEGFPDDLWKKANKLLFGADFGFAQDPSTLVRCFIVDDTLYIENEAYGVAVEFMGNMSGDRGELEQLYRSVPGSDSWSIKGDCSRPETISFIRGIGFNITAADKWPGSVEDGITHMRGFKKIVIHPRCKQTANEFRSYKYKVDRISGDVLPIPVDKNNHCIDAIRYSLSDYIQRRGDLGIWTRLGKGAIL